MSGIFRAYPAFAATSFRDHLRHRVRLAVRFFACLFFMIVFIELWRLIAAEGLVALPWATENILWYVSLTQMMLFLSPRLFMVIDEDVRSGDIAYFLTRPMPYLWMRYAEGIGAMTANALLYYTVGIAVLYLYICMLPSGGWAALLTAMVLLYMGSALHLIFQITAGITAFWLQEAEAVYRIYQKFLIVLGGLYMPVSMYPDWLERIAAFTPVYGMMYGAMRPVLEGASLAVIGESAGLIIFWLIFSVLLMQGVYALCVRRLEVNGG